ncbi:MAG TPA: hypothetical protein VED40_02045 [Azospirillaceae bacterium]|nr:hypothetical protein [Azospirillaceae bacterium]
MDGAVRQQRLEAVLFRTEAFAEEENEALGLRAPWPGGGSVSARAETPSALLEAFRGELEAQGRQRFGGDWVAVPVSDPTDGEPPRLDRCFVLLPLTLLASGLGVLREIGHGAMAPTPAAESADDADGGSASQRTV